MKLLMFTPRVDMNHDVLGFTNTWINELAKYVDQLYIITLGVGATNLAHNVKIYNLGQKNTGLSKYLYLNQLLLNILPKVDGVFAHMFPEFIFMLYPLCKIFGKKIILWYAHGKVTLKLKLSVLLANAAVTSSSLGLRISNNKITIIGQGIDTNTFKPQPMDLHSPLRILSLGRIDPVKNYEVLIEAISLLSKTLPIHLDIIGRPNDDGQYYKNLTQLVASLGLENHITFLGNKPHHQIASYYVQYDIYINTSLTGSLDKTVLEAMSSGIPILTCNPSFLEILGDLQKECMFNPKAPSDLASKIKMINENYNYYKVLALNNLRSLVIRNHSVASLAKKIVKMFE